MDDMEKYNPQRVVVVRAIMEMIPAGWAGKQWGEMICLVFRTKFFE
jgi:hypothetical protein